MKFRTELTIEKSPFEINYKDQLVFIGSCFTDHIGSLLEDRKFNICRNPFGVLFNPSSISNLLTKSLLQDNLQDNLIVEQNNLWHSLELHGNFSDTNRSKLLNNGTQAIQQLGKHLTDAAFLFITFGTSWVYRFKATDSVVANCHKLNSDYFTRSRLSVSEIVSNYHQTLEILLQQNPTLQIIFTVSPIRHLKDGLHENQLSKSTLLLAIDEIMQLFPSNTSYFPSYELILDDLRDYRFYDTDLTHIGSQGIEYIFEKFQTQFLSPTSIKLGSEIVKVTQAKKHRILSKNPLSKYQFADTMLKKIAQIQAQHPSINFEKEFNYFSNLKT